MSTTMEVTEASRITARLDRLPMTRQLWTLVTLIALGGFFEVYDLFFTGYVAPGLFADKILTPTTTSFFGMAGIGAFIAALFTGLFIGTIAFAFVADRYGRRAIFTYSLLWYSVCTLILAFQHTATGLNLWRLIGGVGIGVELVTIDAYISELVPKTSRGKAFAFQQGVGFLAVPTIAFFAWVLVPLSPFGVSGWRWVVIIGSVGALAIWVLRRQLPESPRWLAQRGRAAEAEQIMARIEAQVAAEYGRPLPAPRPAAAELTHAGSYLEVFDPTYRSRTIMMLVVNLGSTIGFYGFANWVPTLLIAKGIHVTQSLEYTFIIALAYPLFAIASVSFADRMERKTQVAASSIGMAICGVIFSLQTSPAALVVLGTIQTMLLTWLSFSFHNYQAEIYPTRIRARAVGFVYSWSRFSAIFTGFLVAFFLKNMGVPGVFVLIGGAMLVVAGAIGGYGPRTNQLALEEIAR
ncbi:MAG TPA: MFS transporter [Acetobacteraceae bacterium]|nr:MFS transporter [Acetobacteraceae bacterium]